MRFYLPYLKAVCVDSTGWPCTAYRYNGLSAQGSTQFVAYASLLTTAKMVVLEHFDLSFSSRPSLPP
jgi:hypothetical protein